MLLEKHQGTREAQETINRTQRNTLDLLSLCCPFTQRAGVPSSLQLLPPRVAHLSSCTLSTPLASLPLPADTPVHAFLCLQCCIRCDIAVYIDIFLSTPSQILHGSALHSLFWQTSYLCEAGKIHLSKYGLQDPGLTPLSA